VVWWVGFVGEEPVLVEESERWRDIPWYQQRFVTSRECGVVFVELPDRKLT
jgi:hypothetical protein